MEKCSGPIQLYTLRFEMYLQLSAQVLINCFRVFVFPGAQLSLLGTKGKGRKKSSVRNFGPSSKVFLSFPGNFLFLVQSQRFSQGPEIKLIINGQRKTFQLFIFNIITQSFIFWKCFLKFLLEYLIYLKLKEYLVVILWI